MGYVAASMGSYGNRSPSGRCNEYQKNGKLSYTQSAKCKVKVDLLCMCIHTHNRSK